jgi:coenzyme F420-0:L-glutamate ligase / coenzyme F420-1:gamma-L-glutamate ligase
MTGALPGAPTGPLTRSLTGSLTVLPLTGLGEIAAGDDLGALIAAAASAGAAGSIGGLADGDVVVVSSKVISKALGLTAAASERDAAIATASVRLVARRRTPHGLASIVQAEAGPVMAAAGVDNSNVTPGTVLLLPADPDHEAARLRARLAALTGLRLGVVVSDTAGRAWRDGQTDLALGVAGVTVTDDLRGAVDTHGQPMEVTVRAVADEIACAADLVKGKLRSVPVAVLRGLGDLVLDPQVDGPGAAALLRPSGQDWFRLGHVEAVRAALGVDPACAQPPTIPQDPVPDRLRRALQVAVTDTRFTIVQDGAEAEISLSAVSMGAPGSLEAPAESSAMDWFALGALAQRISATAWTEDLAVHLTPRPGPPPSLHVQASPCPC